MRFASPLIPARLIRRYKRFLADVVLDDGSETTVHVANPGAMLGLATPGARVLLSRSADPKRKLALSWELVETDFGGGPEWVGVNTAHPNRIAEAAIRAGAIPDLAGYAGLRREVAYGRRSRIDLLLEHPERPPCYVEIKNVHMCRTPGLAEFPDCPTERGARHLDEMRAMVAAGARAVMLYLIQMRATRFTLAADIDADYAKAFLTARAAGVEAIAWTATVTPNGIELAAPVPVIPPAG